MNDQTNDPFESAMNPTIRPKMYWGNIMTDAQFVILEKGPGRIPFDPQQHSMDRRVTAVDFSLLCIAEQNIQNPIERNAVAEFGEWNNHILPSLMKLGVDVRELNGKYVKVELVNTGRKYEAKDALGQPTGEFRDATTFKFLKMFADEGECIADYLSGESEPTEAAAQAQPQAPAQTPQTPAPQSSQTNLEKDTAYKFLEVLVANAANGQQDLNTVRDTLALSLQSAPLVAKHFSVDSPESMELISKAMGL
jgi:hypothetical protein